MKVAMIIPSFRPLVGGAERQLEGLATHLVAAGTGLVVFTRRIPGTVAVEESDGYRVERVFSRIPRIGFGLALFVTLLRRRKDFDLLHCHTLSGQTALACVLAGRFSGTPVILKVTRSGKGAQLYRYRRSRLGRWLFRRLAAGTARFIAITKDVTEELQAAGVAAGRITEIPNGVEPPEARSVENAGPALTIVCVGRLIARKRVDLLIRALETVPMDPPIMLRIIGAGVAEDDLKALANRLGLSDRIRFLGQLSAEAVQTELGAADVFVLPSDSEGMSNALLEAMAQGLPVVAADIAANRALVASGENGLLFETPEQLGTALRMLASDADCRQRIGAAARLIIRESFSFEAISRRYLAEYKVLCRDLLRISDCLCQS